ncbi:MAG TPA: methyltransferase domain-containing protein [Gemmatimonadales bacterium]|jgi:ubiquinone/menaquinone biosynthesis C-methylase UbiE|nr:methyltransferase domain-containing protein [Gemmatimonadales bacterium]
MTQPFDYTFGASAPENYERYFVPAIGRPVAERLMQAARLKAGERVLDVGCGTGVVTRLAAEQVGSGGTVAGVDPSEGMLAVARATAAPASGITWHEAGAESLPLADGAYDVVLSQMALQFVADRSQAMREMKRVLAPGGRVALNVPGRIAPLFQGMADAFGRHISPQVAGFVQAVFLLHDEAELEGLFNDAGFREVRVRTDDVDLKLPGPTAFFRQYVASTPLSAALAGADEPIWTALEHEVVAGWQRFAEGSGMRYTQGIVTATARC